MGFYSERIFPGLMEKSIDKPTIHARRAALVGPVQGDVLEIGFGGGANLPYYDRRKVRSLTAVEPSAGMNVRARERMAALQWSVRLEPLAGEQLPFENNSFDYVISSLTLCSVTDPARVLAEIKRVLRPGGRLRFFEHVTSHDHAKRRWQDRLNPLHKIVGVGCHLNRDTISLMRAAGFEIGDPPHQHEPAFALNALMPIVEGEAVRPI